jgi:hypothetical protein
MDQALLARARAAAQGLMTDAVSIARTTGSTFNPSTGGYVDTTTVQYVGPVDVKNLGVAAGQAQAGEREITFRTYDVKLPFGDSSDIRLDDRVTVTASADPTLVGVVLTVIDVQHGARRTARHLIAEERSS